MDSVGIVLTGLDFINPLLAAFIHISSELVFILNSTRMLPVGHHRLGASESPAMRSASALLGGDR